VGVVPAGSVATHLKSKSSQLLFTNTLPFLSYLALSSTTLDQSPPNMPVVMTSANKNKQTNVA